MAISVRESTVRRQVRRFELTSFVKVVGTAITVWILIMYSAWLFLSFGWLGLFVGFFPAWILLIVLAVSFGAVMMLGNIACRDCKNARGIRRCPRKFSEDDDEEVEWPCFP